MRHGVGSVIFAREIPFHPFAGGKWSVDRGVEELTAEVNLWAHSPLFTNGVSAGRASTAVMLWLAWLSSCRTILCGTSWLIHRVAAV